MKPRTHGEAVAWDFKEAHTEPGACAPADWRHGSSIRSHVGDPLLIVGIQSKSISQVQNAFFGDQAPKMQHLAELGAKIVWPSAPHLQGVLAALASKTLRHTCDVSQRRKHPVNFCHVVAGAFLKVAWQQARFGSFRKSFVLCTVLLNDLICATLISCYKIKLMHQATLSSPECEAACMHCPRLGCLGPMTSTVVPQEQLQGNSD